MRRVVMAGVVQARWARRWVFSVGVLGGVAMG